MELQACLDVDIVSVKCQAIPLPTLFLAKIFVNLVTPVFRNGNHLFSSYYVDFRSRRVRQNQMILAQSR